MNPTKWTQRGRWIDFRTLGSMTVRRHTRYSTEFKIQLVQAYLDGEGSARAIATRHGVPHSLLMIWVKKYGEGELTEEIHLQEQVVEDQAKIAAFERKIGQLTMELDAMKKRALIQPSRKARGRRDQGCPCPTRMQPHEHPEEYLLQATGCGLRDRSGENGRRPARADRRHPRRVPAYGYRRVTHELRRRGLVVNHKRVARVMREHALTPRRVRAWLATTNSNHKQRVYPNPEALDYARGA